MIAVFSMLYHNNRRCTALNVSEMIAILNKDVLYATDYSNCNFEQSAIEYF